MVEYSLLKALLVKENYEKYRHILSLEHLKEFNPTLLRLFIALDSWYGTPGATTLSLDELQLQTLAHFPALKDTDKEELQSLCETISSVDISQTIVTNLLESHLEQAIATKVAKQAVLVATGKATLTSVQEILSQLPERISPAEDANEDMVTTDLSYILGENGIGSGLEWRLEALNRMLGPLQKGKFGFLFARPETGKTTFLASEIAFFAEQLKEEECVLWCNNEEDGKAVQLRIIQAVFGVEFKVIKSDVETFNDLYKKRIGTRIRLYDSAGMSRKSIEKKCEQFNPKLIVLDQIDKIHGFEGDRYDLKMKAIYQWARELSKKYGPVIAVCQAGGTAEGKKWLDMTDVDSSHTAKQGEADWILGIGKVADSGLEFVRYLHASKNKLPEGPRTVSALRHGKLQVVINPAIARYEDSIKWD